MISPQPILARCLLSNFKTMLLAFYSPTVLVIPATFAASLRVVYEFPNITWVENLAVRASRGARRLI